VFSHLITTDSIIDVTAFLNLQMTRIEIGKTDLANVVQINPIYFDFDKFDIRPDAALELDKIVRVMLDNPDIKIELGSHTDTRGSDAYNLWLSDMRAKSSAEYIISNGISNDRIYGKGYGETKLIVTDATIGKKKAKADRERLHQLNRRTEFIIVGVGNSDSRTVEDNRITSKTTITHEIAYSDNQMVVVDYYVVKPNETLYRVFINTGVSVEKLKELNGLKNNNLKAGQKLRLN
jgi:outer membrane protein OmpA-like peptidoglycan-associated protein